MKKAAFQFLVLLILFFSCFYALSRINWVSVFKVEQVTISTEEKLGKLYWQIFSKTEKEITSPDVINPIDSLLARICKQNSIDQTKIKLHILQKDEVNAFTLPDNYLIVYSALISSCENEEELCGVLAHEIAHMQKKHIMKKLVKEVGLSVLISMTTGNSGGEAVKNTAKLLSSSAYDRTIEREADQAAISYLINANIDPSPFANFMYRLSENEEGIPNQVFWISTHPESKERAESIVKYIKGKKTTNKKVLSTSSWNTLKENTNSN